MAENTFLGKASVVVRLIVASAIGGALVAGIALPAVGAIGTIVRNSATKFNTLVTPELHQLPVRSAILDRHGKVLAYYYPRAGQQPGAQDRARRLHAGPAVREERGNPVLAGPAQGVRARHRGHGRPQDPRTAHGGPGRAHHVQGPDPRRVPERRVLR